MVRLKRISLFIFLLAALLFPAQALADSQTEGLYLSEIAWSGSSLSTADEFIEIFNSSKEVIDLSGYSIWDEAKMNSITKAIEPKLMIEIADGQIAPSGNFLIANFSSKSEKSILNIEPDIAESDVALSNESFKISLRNPLGEIVDIAGNGGKPVYYQEISELLDPISKIKYKASIERIIPSDGSLNENWRISSEKKNLKETLDLATPHNSNRLSLLSFELDDSSYILNSTMEKKIRYIVDQEISEISVELNNGISREKIELESDQRIFAIPPSEKCYVLTFRFVGRNGLSRTESVTLKCFLKNYDIKFSEILTSPKDFDWNGDGLHNASDEWFELKNSANLDYDLSDWKITDRAGKTFIFTHKIGPNSYSTFFSSFTKLSLNNSGEALFLWDPSGELIDSIEVPSLSENIAYAKFDSLWDKTNRPTPGGENLKSVSDQKLVENVDKTLKTNQIVSEEKFIQEVSIDVQESIVVEQVIIETIAYPSASFLVGSEGEYFPKLDGSMVLGKKDIRLAEPLIYKPYLVYFIAVLFLSIIFFVIQHGIYRRE